MKTLVNAVLALTLSVPMFGGTRLWVGVIDTKWSTGVNWDGGIPAPGDDVVMRNAAWTTNDLPPGLELHSLTVGEGTHISGNDIVLGAGGLSTAGPPAPGKGTRAGFSSITLAASQTWTDPAQIYFVEVGPTDLNGKTLTMNIVPSAFIESIRGAGTLVQRAGTTYLGASADSRNSVTVEGGWLSIYRGALGAAQVNGGTLDLQHASASNIIVNGGRLWLSEQAFSGKLTFLESPGAGILAIPIDERYVGISGNARFVGSIEVGDGVTLGNAILAPQFYSNHINGWDPMILVNNTGGAPVSGTFLGLPEGAIINNPNWQSFRLSYIGGDGNDVTLTPMPRFSYDALTVVSSSYNPSRDGQAVTFTATVRSASSPTPGTGSVSFYDGAVPLGSASLSASGKATLTITLPAGGHAITAAYPGSEVFASSRGTLRQNVGPVRTRAARP